MIILKKLIDYIFFSRPILFFPAWTSMLLFITLSNHNIDNIDIYLLMLMMALTMASGFIINQIYDIESDKINEKCFYLYDKLISLKEAKWLATLFAVLSISISLQFHLIIIIVNIFSFISGIVYSFKPFNLKDKPFGNIITQTSMGILATSYALNDLNINWALLFIYNIINAILCVLTTIPDIKGDKKIGKQTIAVKYGTHNTTRYSFLFLIIGIVLEHLFIQNELLFYLYLFFIVTFLLYFFIETFKIEYVIRLNLLTQAFVVSYFNHFYVILVIAMYFLGRYYFKKRFNIQYPQLFEE